MLERAQRVLARAQQREPPALAARQHPGGQRGQQARAQRRGLAAARRADDAHQRRTGEPRHHRRHKPLAPEEERGVLDLERRQPLERTGDRLRPDLARLGALTQRLQLHHLAGQLVLGRAQARALGRRAAREGVDTSCRRRARRLGGQAMHLLRHPAAVLEQSLGAAAASSLVAA